MLPNESKPLGPLQISPFLILEEGSPELCADREPDHERCAACPLTRLDRSEKSFEGQLILRALELREYLKLGITIGLEELGADEIFALTVLEEESNIFENERMKNA